MGTRSRSIPVALRAAPLAALLAALSVGLLGCGEGRPSPSVSPSNPPSATPRASGTLARPSVASTASAGSQSTPGPPSTPTPRSLPPGVTPSPTPLFSPTLTQPPDSGNGYGVAGLRPSLSNAPNDREWTWTDGCEVNHSQTKPCTKVYGDPNGTFNVVMLGDSHAASLFPAVAEVAKVHGWRVRALLKVGCQFLDMRLMYTVAPESEYTACATFKNNVIATLNKNPPDLILVMDNRYSPVVIGSQGTVTYEGQALGREIGRLPSKSRVVIIKDYPYSPFNVPDCLGNHLSDWRKCSFSYDRGVGYSQNGKREKIAAGMTGADVVNIDQAICPGEGTCPPVINGMIVWRDEHHLTKTFSATIGWAVDQALAPIIVKMQKHGANP